MNAISIQGISKVYASGTQALKSIDLTVQEGDFFALLGINGAGKTTTIGILTGLVTKTSGTVQVFEYDLDTQIEEVKSCIGVVPQEFNFNIFEKVIDIIVAQAGYYGIPRNVALERAEGILKKLSLWEKRDAKAQELSGGMKRRLMIARALIHQPRLLILDEPTAGVDVDLRRGMWDYLRELNAQGMTILLTTHYLEEVEQLCRNAAVIHKGEIILNDSVKNLMNSLDREVYVVTVDNAKKVQAIENVNVIDEYVIELTVRKGESLTQALSNIEGVGVQIESIRPKSNRMEELFLSAVHD